MNATNRLIFVKKLILLRIVKHSLPIKQKKSSTEESALKPRKDTPFHFSMILKNYKARYIDPIAEMAINTKKELNFDLNTSPSSDLCLHVQVLKIGKILVVESKTSKAFGTSSTLPSSQSSTSNSRLQRPFVATIINFSEILKPERERERIDLLKLPLFFPP